MAEILKKEMLLEKWDYIIFSRDNSPCWNTDPNLNNRFLISIEEFLKMKIYAHGYALVTDLLGHLGLEVEPNQILAGWKFEKNVKLGSSLFEIFNYKDGSILIHFLNCNEFLVDDIYKGRVDDIYKGRVKIGNGCNEI